MDNLAHSLFGAALAKAGLARRFGRGTTVTLLLASNLPDLDFLLALAQGGDETLLSRRCFTHSVLGGPALALGCALLLKPFLKGLPFLTLFLLSLLGVAGHILLDLINAFGVVLLHPADPTRFELGWVFILDPVMWALPATPLLLELSPRWRGRTEGVARAMLAGLALYLGLCAAARSRAEALLAAAEPSAQARWVFPEALGCHRWRGIAREGETFRLHLIHVLDGSLEPKGTERTETGDPAVREAMGTERGRRLAWFAGAPLWRRTPDGAVEMVDLRFRSLLLPGRRDPFRFQVP